MSTESLKFFEEKNTEEIINWMLSNLSEDQIRMCLDQSGIPDTSVVQGKQPIAAAAAASTTPIQTITLPDGSQKQLQPGEGSSTDPPPATTQPKERAEKLFLDKYRKRCENTGYLIKSVSKDGVQYFEFAETEEGDDVVSPDVSIGDVGWIKKTVPMSEFKDFCTDEDREIFDILKQENLSTFLNAPPEVMEVSASYPSSGLVSPIPIQAPTLDVSDAPEPTPVTQSVEITEPMIKALKIQQSSSTFLNQTYPDLYQRGLTMYPIFVYNSNGDNVLHLTTVVSDGKLSFIQDSTNKKLLNSKMKKITASIQDAVNAGMYTPTDDIQEELNVALTPVSEEIKQNISQIYDPIKVSGYTYFGSLEDEPGSQGSFDMIGSQDFDEEMLLVPEGESPQPQEIFNMSDMSDVIQNEQLNLNVQQSTPRNKKVSDMTIPEIEERMRIQFGEQYVRDYKPEKYVNSLGVTNVRYVKRPNCPVPEEPVLVKTPIFTEFQGRPSVNMGPGRFGEHMGSDDELLFG